MSTPCSLPARMSLVAAKDVHEVHSWVEPAIRNGQLAAKFVHDELRGFRNVRRTSGRGDCIFPRLVVKTEYFATSGAAGKGQGQVDVLGVDGAAARFAK